MIESVIHLRLLPTSILDLKKTGMESQGHMGSSLVTPAKLTPDLGILGRLWSVIDAIVS